MAATPAATLLAAFNGKPTATTPGNNYGGYNPFGTGANSSSTNSASSGNAYQDPGSQAQNDVAQSQTDYATQQANAKSQLQASLSPASVGGGAGINSGQNGSGQNSDPFSNFNSQVQAIQQRGIDATSSLEQTNQQNFQNQLSSLAQQYSTNMANPATWTDSDVQSMLQKLPGFQSSPIDYSSLIASLPAGTDPNSLGARAVAIAKTVVANGTPYVYGGNSLSQGVDCSGLVQQVYERLGIQLPRTSTEQAKAGKVVPSLSQALPGDLILMYSPYEPAGLQQYGHVGLYIGNGMMIDAAHTGTDVRVEPIVNMTGIVRPW